MTIKERLIEYIKPNVEQDELRTAWGRMEQWRCPLSHADDYLESKITDLIDEFYDDELPFILQEEGLTEADVIRYDADDIIYDL